MDNHPIISPVFNYSFLVDYKAQQLQKRFVSSPCNTKTMGCSESREEFSQRTQSIPLFKRIERKEKQYVWQTDHRICLLYTSDAADE